MIMKHCHPVRPLLICVSCPLISALTCQSLLLLNSLHPKEDWIPVSSGRFPSDESRRCVMLSFDHFTHSLHLSIFLSLSFSLSNRLSFSLTISPSNHLLSLAPSFHSFPVRLLLFSFTFLFLPVWHSFSTVLSVFASLSQIVKIIRKDERGFRLGQGAVREGRRRGHLSSIFSSCISHAEKWWTSEKKLKKRNWRRGIEESLFFPTLPLTMIPVISQWFYWWTHERMIR